MRHKFLLLCDWESVNLFSTLQIDHFIKPVYRETECAEIITSNPDFYLYVFEVGVTVAQAILKEMLVSEMYEPIHREIETLINAEKKDSNKNNT